MWWTLHLIYMHLPISAQPTPRSTWFKPAAHGDHVSFFAQLKYIQAIKGSFTSSGTGRAQCLGASRSSEPAMPSCVCCLQPWGQHRGARPCWQHARPLSGAAWPCCVCDEALASEWATCIFVTWPMCTQVRRGYVHPQGLGAAGKNNELEGCRCKSCREALTHCPTLLRDAVEGVCTFWRLLHM